MLITWQHAASVLGYYEATQWQGISPGQIGVSVFCAISGFLAFYSKPASIIDWFAKRMIRIFPAYWLATIGAFALALIGSEKEITFWLFISQMLGIGYFTHGWNLINVVSWFISLLILCYLLAAISLKNGWPRLPLLIIFSFALLVCVSRTEVALSRHVMAFALAGILALPSSALFVFTISVVLLLCGLTFDPQLFYAGFAISLLAWVRWVSFNDHVFVNRAANFSYEYFLIHGVCLVVAIRFFKDPWLGISLAVFVAMVGAVILNKLSNPITLFLRRKMTDASKVALAD